MAQDFDSLRADVTAFKAIMETAVKQAGDELSKEIQETTNLIEQLQVKLSKWGVVVRNS